MPDIDLGALTIPVFVAIFGAGWGACVKIMVEPMKTRLAKLESKLDRLEEDGARELAELRARFRA